MACGACRLPVGQIQNLIPTKKQRPISINAGKEYLVTLDHMQKLALCVAWAILGACLASQSLTRSRTRATHSRLYTTLIILAAAVVAPAAWFLLMAAIDRLPSKWNQVVPIAILGGLFLHSKWRPHCPSVEEKRSTHRLQLGILIGGCVLLAVCLILFRPSH